MRRLAFTRPLKSAPCSRLPGAWIRTLAAWLALPGKLPVSNPERVRAVARASGVRWPRNVTRHSFCSYHLARYSNAARTALEAGHSEAMLSAHYRELVTPEAASGYWAIVPATGPSDAAR